MFYIALKDAPGMYYQRPGVFTSNMEDRKHMGVMAAEKVHFRLASIGIETRIYPVPIPTEDKLNAI